MVQDGIIFFNTQGISALILFFRYSAGLFCIVISAAASFPAGVHGKSGAEIGDVFCHDLGSHEEVVCGSPLAVDDVGFLLPDGFEELCGGQCITGSCDCPAYFAEGVGVGAAGHAEVVFCCVGMN